MELFQKIKDKYPYLPEDRILDVLSLGEIVMLNVGDIFIKEGEKTSKAGLVIEGMMRNYIVNDNGEEVTVVFATEMQPSVPYSSFFLGRAASETTAAVEPTILFVMDFLAFKSRSKSDLLYARLYADLLEEGYLAAIERIEDFTRTKPEQRYQRLLDTRGFLIERAPLKYLASYLGITPVSLSRIRKRVSQNR